MELRIRLATSDDRQNLNHIVEQNPHAQIILLESGSHLVAWCSFDRYGIGEQPELYAQSVLPDYRGFYFGSLLIYTLTRQLLDLGEKHLYFRTEAPISHHTRDIQKTLDTRFELDSTDLQFNLNGICQIGSLYQDEHGQKALMCLNLERFTSGIERLFRIEKLNSEQLQWKLQINGREFHVLSTQLTFTPQLNLQLIATQDHSNVL